MSANWARGDRFRVKRDCRGEHVAFKAGQTGRVVAVLGLQAAVELDGYDAERTAAEQYRQRFGEAPNVVSWADLLALEHLEPLAQA